MAQQIRFFFLLLFEERVLYLDLSKEFSSPPRLSKKMVAGFFLLFLFSLERGGYVGKAPYRFRTNASFGSSMDTEPGWLRSGRPDRNG